MYCKKTLIIPKSRKILFLRKNKKGISSVIATSLLLVVAVFSIISFQNWFGIYSSQIFSETEIQSSEDLSGTRIES